jgi:hypothetical protein
MKILYNAFYFIIFVGFLRRIVDKVKVSVEHEIPVQRTDDSDEYFVTVNGMYFTWEESYESAIDFCYSAIAKCRSLAGKFTIIETADDHVLVAAETIPGLDYREIEALNSTIEDFE